MIYKKQTSVFGCKSVRCVHVCTDEIAGRARNDVSGHPGQLTSPQTTHVTPDNLRHPGPDPGSVSFVCADEYRGPANICTKSHNKEQNLLIPCYKSHNKA